jgi:hypothetical protein
MYNLQYKQPTHQETKLKTGTYITGTKTRKKPGPKTQAVARQETHQPPKLRQ